MPRREPLAEAADGDPSRLRCRLLHWSSRVQVLRLVLLQQAPDQRDDFAECILFLNDCKHA